MERRKLLRWHFLPQQHRRKKHIRMERWKTQRGRLEGQQTHCSIFVSKRMLI